MVVCLATVSFKTVQPICTAKETINKMKRQPTDWEKIFANDAANKGLFVINSSCSSILKKKKTSNPIK